MVVFVFLGFGSFFVFFFVVVVVVIGSSSGTWSVGIPKDDVDEAKKVGGGIPSVSTSAYSSSIRCFLLLVLGGGLGLDPRLDKQAMGGWSMSIVDDGGRGSEGGKKEDEDVGRGIEWWEEAGGFDLGLGFGLVLVFGLEGASASSSSPDEEVSSMISSDDVCRVASFVPKRTLSSSSSSSSFVKLVLIGESALWSVLVVDALAPLNLGIGRGRERGGGASRSNSTATFFTESKVSALNDEIDVAVVVV